LVIVVPITEAKLPQNARGSRTQANSGDRSHVFAHPSKQGDRLAMVDSTPTEGINIHFISGLPRSGSTLLATLLRQNPRFSADMTSPVADLCGSALRTMSSRMPLSVFIDDGRRRDILMGLFLSYYKQRSPDAVVFDTNRIWCAKLALLSRLFPNCRVICCVRDISWILDSFERLSRKNAFEPSLAAAPDQPGPETVYSRVETWANRQRGTVGLPLSALREAYYGEFADRLVLLEYDALVSNPGSAMSFLYEAIGEPLFEHDFDNLTYENGQEFDHRLGAPGLHEVRRKISFEQRQSILPPDLFEHFFQDKFWTDPAARNPRVLCFCSRDAAAQHASRGGQETSEHAA
jgi:sulfotransferase